VTRPVEPGEVIDAKYEILRRIGKGGMGVVFEARHATIGRRLAVKFLRADLLSEESRLRRFEREARNCGALQHENITAVLDFATDDVGRPYIVMEFVEGLSLRELLETEPRPSVQRACDLICQAARGLGAAHQAGILHRDLKPENLMLTRRADGSDWLKLLDFGVARLTEDLDTPLLTREGQTPGTPHYLAPEIARGEQPATVLSDIYSLGVVLFELLTGRRPHRNGSYNAVLRHVADGPAVAIAELRPDLPAPLVRVVDRMLSRDPAERPESAFAVVTDLHASQPQDSRVGETATVTSPGSPGMRDGVRHPKRARRWPLVALLLLVAASVAIVVVHGASSRKPSDTVSATTERTAAPPPKPPRSDAHPKPGKADEFAGLGAEQTPPPSVRATRPVTVEPPERQPARRPNAKRPGVTLRAAGSSAAMTPESPAGSFDRQNPYRD
jgi:eukaryotic-like serine/threonine-protein kinase